MKLKTLITNCFICLLYYSTMAQSPDLNQPVTLHYDGVTIDYALTDISQRYQANFMYSEDLIPVQDRVTVHVIEKPFEAALDELFYTTKVDFVMIAGQIVLKIDPDKEVGLLSEVEGEDEWDGVLSNGTVITPYTGHQKPTSVFIKNKKIQQSKIVLEEPAVKIVEKDTLTTYLSDNTFFEEDELEEDLERQPETQTLFKDPLFKKKKEKKKKKQGKIIKGQISLVPMLSSNTMVNPEEVNNLSVNIFWGHNQNLDGLEIGGLVNSLEHNMKGVQLAGLGNVVKGEVRGSQFTAGINFVKGKSKGFQGAMVGNIAVEKIDGVQLAGVGNVALRASNTTQVAIGVNYSEESIRKQVSMLVNIAEHVERGQVAGILNKATTVEGFQLGFLNIADTVQGASIGLLSLVQSGYNRIEIAGHPNGLQANLGLKLGTKRFYNIFQSGIRVDNFANNTNNNGTGNTSIENIPAWGIGYGFGTAITFSNRFLLNIEATATHVNEKTFWTKELNLLNQINLTLDWRWGRRFSFFAGPTLNMMFSKLYNPETMEYGSQIAGKAFVNETSSNGVNTKMWLGMSAGFRF